MSTTTLEKQENKTTGFDTRFQTSLAAQVDVESLKRELLRTIKGEVRFDDGSRALYATDASNYRQVPIGVVIPKSKQDILDTVAICRKYKSPLLSRGGGTSLVGQCCNVAVVMDMSKYYNAILNIDEDKKLVKVEPGIVLDKMRHTTERQIGLTFGPDPATHSHCTLGGMLGNNSCGIHSVMAQNFGYGARTSDNTERLTILTYDGLLLDVGPTSESELEKFISEGGRKGQIYKDLKAIRDQYADLIREKFPDIPRRVSGYNLDELLPENGFNVARALVGTESTCVTIVDATLKLMPKPKKSSLLVVGYPDVFAAGKHAPLCMKHKPIGLEGIDHELIDFMELRGLNMDDLSLLPDGKALLLVEFGGETKEQADQKCKDLMADLKKADDAPKDMQIFDNAAQEKKLWEVRESGLGATAFVPDKDDTWPGWEDAAVPPLKVGDYLKDLKQLFDKFGYDASIYGHFGQGCIHCRINFDLTTAAGIEQYKKFTHAGAELVIRYGGSISGEHGDGQGRADLLEIMFGKELLEAFRKFKQIWDPEGMMNPGKVVDPYHRDENLRIGTDYNPKKTETHFAFEQEGGFDRAVLHCVGVGNCRRAEGGTMCPSYMVTKEEKNSTRGRSRMLFEMLQGEVIDGWKSEEVKDSLDLCLACKGCKGDCPVHVDMATYKSEFLSHYYEGKLRPRSAYAFGWIYWWSRMASLAPKVANFFTSNPISAAVMKAAAGVAPQRKIPQFADKTFRNWFHARKKQEKQQKKKVILWADTFNNFFLPETLVAGTDVLEAAGFEVIVPKQMLCCGRPLYDFGMLKTAKKLLKDILDALRTEIRAGIPVVGLEPSCVAVFRDELCNLFPHDLDAKRLKSQTFTLAEFLEKDAKDFEYPQLQQKALVHGHCHHHAIMKMDDEQKVLSKLGLDFEIMDSGCCGMAGYFGYEKGEHYEVGLASANRVLLPTIEKAAPSTLIIADGFSCREMIAQESPRKGMHLAQVLQKAIREKGISSTEDFPEKKYVDRMKLKTKKPSLMVTVLACLAITSAAIWLIKE
ncbi:MAG TPA: FAD-binding and (Fe-S)-binding domain-containing protein [Pelobium sp.]